MKVVILSSHRPNIWKPRLIEDAAALGWDVTRLPDTTSDWRIARACQDADLLLWLFTRGRRPGGDALAMLQRVQDAGTRTAGVHLDLYWGLQRREHRIGASPWWSCQTVFTADGHPRPWADRGVNHAWMPPATGAGQVGAGRFREDLACDVAFVGTYKHHPEWEYRPRLIDELNSRYGSRFRWFGRGSPHGMVAGQDLADLCASAKVIVGDSCNPGFQVKRYWSDRLPLMLGHGAALVHPAVVGMGPAGFVNGRTLRTYPFGDFDQLADVVDELLDDPGQRARLSQAGMRLVADRHTWTVRLAEITQAVGL